MSKPNQNPDNEPVLTIDDLVIANTLREAWQQDLFAPVRIRKGYRASQQQLADTLGVTRPTLSRWESGQRSPSNYWLLRWFQDLSRLANYKPESTLGPNWATEFVRLYFVSDNKRGSMDKTITLQLHSLGELLPAPSKLVCIVIKGTGGDNDIWLSAVYSEVEEAFVDVNFDVIVDEVDYWFYLPEV